MYLGIDIYLRPSTGCPRVIYTRKHFFYCLHKYHCHTVNIFAFYHVYIYNLWFFKIRHFLWKLSDVVQNWKNPKVGTLVNFIMAMISNIQLDIYLNITIYCIMTLHITDNYTAKMIRKQFCAMTRYLLRHAGTKLI